MNTDAAIVIRDATSADLSFLVASARAMALETEARPLAEAVVTAGVAGLLATFAAMFLALGHAAQLPLLQALLGHADWNAIATVYFGGIAASQLISNVPATVLLAPYTAHTILLASAVNVAGSGLAIGSLANLIALRIDGSRGALGAFHRISIPYLLLAMALLYALLRLLH